MIGKRLGNLSFCDKFEPTVLNGQLCYSLNLSQATSLKSRPGQQNSLNIVLDQPSGFGLKGVEKSMATIHFGILRDYQDQRPGKYYMSALKKMTGTDAFMALSNSEKGCQLKSYADCKTENVFSELERDCNCIPWELARFQNVSSPF